MIKGLRFATIGLVGLTLAAGTFACSHGAKSEDNAEVRTKDDDRSDVEKRANAATNEVRKDAAEAKEKVKASSKKVVKRTQAAADRTAAAVAAGVPEEGSEEEYAADVDAAMGDETAPVTTDATRSVSASAAVGTQADNSRVNRLSDGDKGLSADQQGNSKSDVEITRKIRRSITSNKALSTYAHNVKIITRDGRVVLKGPVRSEDERKIIEDSAVTVAGIENVTSGLEVKAK
jgi:hyperosmotically inducible protein